MSLSTSAAAAGRLEAELVSTSRCFHLGDQNMRINRNQIWAQISFSEDDSVYSAVVLRPVSSSSSVSCRYLCPHHISHSSTFRDTWETPRPRCGKENKQKEELLEVARCCRVRMSSSLRLLSGSHFTAGKCVPVETHTSLQRTTLHTAELSLKDTHTQIISNIKLVTWLMSGLCLCRYQHKQEVLMSVKLLTALCVHTFYFLTTNGHVSNQITYVQSTRHNTIHVIHITWDQSSLSGNTDVMKTVCRWTTRLQSCWWRGNQSARLSFR